MTPTSRTLKYYRDAGYMVGVVERFNSHTKTRHDLFGFIDLVAVRNGRTVGIQATSTGTVSSRIAKIRDERHDEALQWLMAGNEIVVIGWKKYKKAIDRKYWRETITQIEMHDSNPSKGEYYNVGRSNCLKPI